MDVRNPYAKVKVEKSQLKGRSQLLVWEEVLSGERTSGSSEVTDRNLAKQEMLVAL